MTIHKLIIPIKRRIAARTLAVITSLLVCSMYQSMGQNRPLQFHFTKPGINKVSIPFKLVHNLIVIPVMINNSDTLNFILDSGINNTLITGIDRLGNVNFNLGRKIEIQGLGRGGKIDAIHSFSNTMQLPKIVSYNQNVVIITEGIDFVSQGLGMQIHGMIGHDLFSAFVIEINYLTSHITLYKRSFYEKNRKHRHLKKGWIQPLEIRMNRPFLQLSLSQDEREYPLWLLIDTGASYALSLFKSTLPELQIPDEALNTFIGIGLNGEIYGRVMRGDTIHLGPATMPGPILTFPEEHVLESNLDLTNRNGSIGADVLRRFHVVFDYSSKMMILRPNFDFRKPFRYNLSGIELLTPDPHQKRFVISNVTEGSPAWEAGLRIGDQLEMINGSEAKIYTLGTLIEKLQSKPGRKIKMVVRRNDFNIRAEFRLKDLLAQ